MHELAIVDTLILEAERAIASAGESSSEPGQVACLKLSLGPFSCANPDALHFTFELLTKDGPLQGAKLDIEHTLAKCTCRECGFAGEVKDVWAGCPSCGSHLIEVDGDNEIVLSSIVFEGPEKAEK